MVLRPEHSALPGVLAGGALGRVLGIDGNCAFVGLCCDAGSSQRGSSSYETEQLVAVAPDATRALVRTAGGVWLAASVLRPLLRGAAPPGALPCGAHATFADGSTEAHVVRVAHATRAPTANSL